MIDWLFLCDRYHNATEVIRDLQQLKSQAKSNLVSPKIRLYSTQKLLGVGLISFVTRALFIKILPPLLYDPQAKDYPIDFAMVCNSPIIKGEKLKNYQGTPEHLTFKSSSPIWTVFRWKCVYTF